MSISLTTPVTGAAQTGFTAPTYTVTSDTPPDVNAKQWVVTALGGTQAGVRTHAVSDPFSIAFFRPKVPAALPNPNPITGRYGKIPMNRHSQVVRKGVNFAANQAPLVAIQRILTDVPAGADAYDAPNVRALYSLSIGSQSQQSSGIGDTACNGVL